MRIPVHCCCNPRLRLGYIEHPNLQRLGDTLRIVEPTTWPAKWTRDVAVAAPDTLTEVELEVERLWMNGQNLDAIKSNERPLSFWRRVPGFIEDEGRI